MAADLFFLASSPALIDDEALARAPRLVLVVCWCISSFLLRFVVLFAAAKLSFAPAKPLFAPTKPSFAATKRKRSAADNRKWGYKTMRYAMPDCLFPLSPCCIL